MTRRTTSSSSLLEGTVRPQRRRLSQAGAPLNGRRPDTKAASAGVVSVTRWWSWCLVVAFGLVFAGAAQATPPWSEPSELSAHGGLQYAPGGQLGFEPQVAIDDSGNAIAVWQYYGDCENPHPYPPSHCSQIQASVRLAGSGVWGPAETLDRGVSRWPAGDAYFVNAPGIAADGSGNAIAVWSRSDGHHDSRVQASVRPASTGVWSTPQTLARGGAPRVAFDGSGNATVVWQRYDGSHAGVQASVLSASTGAWSTPETLSEAGQNAYSPQIAVDRSGNATAIWTRSDGSHNRVQAAVRPAGGVWGTPETLSAADQDAHYPQVAVAGSGNAIVVWERYEGSNEHEPGTSAYRAQASVRSASTGTWSTPETLSDERDIYAHPREGASQVAIDEDGNATVVWYLRDGTLDLPGGTRSVSRHKVQAVVRKAFVADRSSGVWGPVETLSAANQSARSPQVAVDGDGNATVVWSTTEPIDENGTVGWVQAAVRPLGGAWGAPVDVSEARQYDPDEPWVHVSTQYPQIAVNGSGNAVAVWKHISGDWTNQDDWFWVRASVFDTDAPVLSDLVVPTVGTAGSAVAVSVTAVDAFAGVTSVTWDFGDASPTVTGMSVTHTFASAGTYTVTVTAADAAGNTSVLSSPITMQAPSSTAGTGPESSPVTVPAGCTIVGTAGDDVLVGTSGDDHICGLGGNDKIYGKGGNDILDGGPGNDILKGAKGKDRLYGRGGRDALKGGSHNDKIWGQGGKDKLWGQGGKDILNGGPKKDVLNGGKGKDTAKNPGPDRLKNIAFLRS